ncbi:MAG: hypothetical protein WA399_06260 [Acidobacteriaceae bacterium]
MPISLEVMALVAQRIPRSILWASRKSRRLRPGSACSFLLSSLLWTAAVAHAAPEADITCNRGDGAYATTFQTGVTVEVNPVKAGGFATRVCDAKLTWAGGELEVAKGAEQVGIDLLGTNLGFRVPVVAFQIRASQTDTLSEYRIYSLSKPPTLLRTLTGGSGYRAADTDLNGHLEIWTDDTKAVDGFEEIPAAILDFAPTVVLRVENGKLIDVSSEFQPYYDQQIASVRAHLDARALNDFRSTDGRLTPSAMSSATRLAEMLHVKAQVLEIVWCYLYSGRASEAWQALAAMWPAGDIDRVRALLVSLPTHGILAQADGVEHRKRTLLFKSHADIYDITQPKEQSAPDSLVSSPLGPIDLSKQAAVSEPQPILLRRPHQTQENLAPLDENEFVELVIDAAGKVHSARVLSGTDTSLIAATKGWQFIPAFREGEPVACRFRMRAWDLR